MGCLYCIPACPQQQTACWYCLPSGVNGKLYWFMICNVAQVAPFELLCMWPVALLGIQGTEEHEFHFFSINKVMTLWVDITNVHV